MWMSRALTSLSSGSCASALLVLAVLYVTLILSSFVAGVDGLTEHKTLLDDDNALPAGAAGIHADEVEAAEVLARQLQEKWMKVRSKKQGDAVLHRQRRQATPSSNPTISDLRAILDLFGIGSVEQCTPLFNGILSQCNEFVGTILQLQFRDPVINLLGAYRQIATGSACAQQPQASCLTNHAKCNTLTGLLQMWNVNTSQLDGEVASQAAQICSQEPAGVGSPLVTTLQLLLSGLNSSLPLAQLLNNLTCVGELQRNHPTVFPQIASITRNGVVISNTFALLQELQNKTASLKRVQFELPNRIYHAFRNLESEKLAPAVNETYVNVTTSFLLCNQIYPSHFSACPWLCRNLSAVFDLAGLIDRDETNLASSAAASPDAALLWLLSNSCANRTGWDLCLDSACTPNMVCVPVPSSVTPRNATTAQLASILAAHQASGACFNSTCPEPLKKTDVIAHYNEDIQNVLRAGHSAVESLLTKPEFNYTFNASVLPCGLGCHTITFNEDDEKTAKIVIGVFSWLLFALGIFALVTFYLNRERLNKYPTKILLYVNTTSLISNFGNLSQFFTDKDNYVCFPDKTLRQGEPISGTDSGGIGCTFIFIILFYFLLVSLFWWLALAHAWYVTFKKLDSVKASMLGDEDRYLYIYHAIVWTVPAILTSIMLGQNYVDGFPLIGVCFTNNVNLLFALLSVPIVVVGVMGLPFLFKGSYELVGHKKHLTIMRHHRRPSTRSMRSQAGLRNFLVKLMIIMIMSFINLLVQFAVGLYMRVSWQQWRDEIEDHVRCMITRCSEEQQCPELPHPSVFPFILITLTIILEGMVLCLWVFARDTWSTWQEATRKPSAFFRRASSLPIVRQLRGNDKPSIANITAARKAAKHLHMKASQRRQNNPTDSTNGKSVGNSTSASYSEATPTWDPAATDILDTSLASTTAPEQPLENSQYITEPTIPEAALPNGNASKTDGAPAANGKQKSRVTITNVVSTSPAPGMSRPSPLAMNGSATSPTGAASATSPTTDTGRKTNIGMELAEMPGSPGSRRRHKNGGNASESQFKRMTPSPSEGVPTPASPVEKAKIDSRYTELSESPGARRRSAYLDSMPPRGETDSTMAEARSLSPLSQSLSPEPASTPSMSSFQNALADSNLKLMEPESDACMQHKSSRI